MTAAVLMRQSAGRGRSRRQPQLRSWSSGAVTRSCVVQLCPGEVEVVEGVAPDGGGEEAAELRAGQLRVGEVQPRHLSVIMCCHTPYQQRFCVTLST